MPKRPAPKHSRPKRITLPVTFDEVVKEFGPRDKRTAETRAPDNDFLDEVPDPGSDDDTCAIPGDQVPAVLRPPSRRKNDDVDEYGYNPVVRDAAQGAEVDAYMEANWTPKQFSRGIPELSRQGANNMAIVNWMFFESNQKWRLTQLCLKMEDDGINEAEQLERSKLIAWFRKRPCSLEMAPSRLQRWVADG